MKEFRDRLAVELTRALHKVYMEMIFKNPNEEERDEFFEGLIAAVLNTITNVAENPDDARVMVAKAILTREKTPGQDYVIMGDGTIVKDGGTKH